MIGMMSLIFFRQADILSLILLSIALRKVSRPPVDVKKIFPILLGCFFSLSCRTRISDCIDCILVNLKQTSIRSVTPRYWVLVGDSRYSAAVVFMVTTAVFESCAPFASISSSMRRWA